MRLVIVSLLAFAAQACPPSPAPPSPDASDASVADAGDTVYARACANLAARGCSEGTDPKCASVLEHVATTKLTRIDAACLAVAESKASARACGGVSCQ